MVRLVSTTFSRTPELSRGNTISTSVVSPMAAQ